MEQKKYSIPVVEIVLIKEDLVRTSGGWAGLEKDPTMDDPFVGGGFA